MVDMIENRFEEMKKSNEKITELEIEKVTLTLQLEEKKKENAELKRQLKENQQRETNVNADDVLLLKKWRNKETGGGGSAP